MRNIDQQGERVETGGVQFGDDWPGVFIRGDDALGYVTSIEKLVRGEGEFYEKAILSNLAGILKLSRSTQVNESESE